MHRPLLIFVLLTAVATAGGKFEYVGTHKCAGCHKSKKKGAQYKVWLETKHAHAWEALESAKAKEIAKKKGIKVAPTEAPECVRCHTVGFGKGGYEIKPASFWNDPNNKKAIKRMKNLRNVGCEACHGPGSAYKKKKVMKGIFNGTLNAADYGLLKPDAKTCKQCHNSDSPTSKKFVYNEFVKKIAHPFPAGMKKSQ